MGMCSRDLASGLPTMVSTMCMCLKTPPVLEPLVSVGVICFSAMNSDSASQGFGLPSAQVLVDTRG